MFVAVDLFVPATVPPVIPAMSMKVSPVSVSIPVAPIASWFAAVRVIVPESAVAEVAVAELAALKEETPENSYPVKA